MENLLNKVYVDVFKTVIVTWTQHLKQGPGTQGAVNYLWWINLMLIKYL